MFQRIAMSQDSSALTDLVVPLVKAFLDDCSDMPRSMPKPSQDPPHVPRSHKHSAVIPYSFELGEDDLIYTFDLPHFDIKNIDVSMDYKGDLTIKARRNRGEIKAIFSVPCLSIIDNSGYRFEAKYDNAFLQVKISPPNMDPDPTHSNSIKLKDM